MKDKHLKIRIEQCLSLSKASNCPRRKFGALLLDPERNVILMDGYNGAPRNGGELCQGSFCSRNGLKSEDISFKEVKEENDLGQTEEKIAILLNGEVIKSFSTKYDSLLSSVGAEGTALQKAEKYKDSLLKSYPPIESGRQLEIGCHHAEMNVICNAAANGVKTSGSWLFINGSSCLMCAKHIHHAGIKKVIVIAGQYSTEEGMEYLRKHGVETEYRDQEGNLL